MPERDEQRREVLFEEYGATGSTEVRNELVESYAPLAIYFANRYSGHGSDDADLRQVANLALIKAVDRFDPEYGVAFSTFAGRTINGELKRYFRDRTWTMRVPRGLQEAAIEVRDVVDELTLELARAPTISEIAGRTGFDDDVVLQALDVRASLRPQSLDRPTFEDESGPSEMSGLGQRHRRLERTAVLVTLDRLIADLPERDRTIIDLRFRQEKSQQEIARELGVSQVHVSRLLRRILEELRQELR